MNVPFLDLKAQYRTLKDEIVPALDAVMEQTAFAGGPFVERFETKFAEFCGTRHAVGVGNGTDALWAALIGLGIGPGDEVITAANTFIATAEAISFAGAKPVFVDVDEATYNIDPGLIERAITPKTKAIIPVHLYGQMADMDPIMEIARSHTLPVIEDASQAHGSTYKGRIAGSIGDAGCFSFYPGKNLGAYGEAGAVVTSNDDLAKAMKMFRDHGQSKKYYHDIVGWNARMDGMQGAVLEVKLRYIDEWNNRRRAHAKTYGEALAGIRGVSTPIEAANVRHVYHIYVIQVADPQALIDQLRQKEVFCARHYPVPLHLQKAYCELGSRAGDFPVAERCAQGQVSLPMFPELTDAQIEYVAESIRSILS